MISVDVSGLDDWVNSLAAIDVAESVGPVLSKAGLNMKNGAREDAPDGPHLAHYRRTILYHKVGKLAVEMGPQEQGQGLLSAVLEFGQGPNAPHPHILPQLDRELPNAKRYLAEVILKAITG